MTKPVKASARDVQAYAQAREEFSTRWRSCAHLLRMRLGTAGYRMDVVAPAETLLSLARYSEDAAVQESLRTVELRMFTSTQSFLRALARLPESERRTLGLSAHTAMVAHFDHYTDRPVTPKKLGAVLRWTESLRDAVRAVRRKG